MEDREFLMYCYSHSETPRALFSGKQIMRLRRMAGVEVPDLEPDGWWSCKSYNGMHDLVNKAREIMEIEK